MKTDTYDTALLALKEKLQTADNFSEIMRFFFDHLAEDPGFLELGKNTKHPTLKRVIATIGEQLFGERVLVTRLRLMKIKKQGFYHGACLVVEQPANVFYFEDIDMGLLAILQPGSRSETHYARFTCYRVKADRDTVFKAGNQRRH